MNAHQYGGAVFGRFADPVLKIALFAASGRRVGIAEKPVVFARQNHPVTARAEQIRKDQSDLKIQIFFFHAVHAQRAAVFSAVTRVKHDCFRGADRSCICGAHRNTLIQKKKQAGKKRTDQKKQRTKKRKNFSLLHIFHLILL